MTDAQDPGDHPQRTLWTDRRLTIVMLVVLLMLGGFEAARFVNSVSARRTIDTSAKTLEIVERATSPESVAKANAQTARAVSSINETTIIAVYCGRQGGDVPTMTRCVAAEYTKLHPESTGP